MQQNFLLGLRCCRDLRKSWCSSSFRERSGAYLVSVEPDMNVSALAAQSHCLRAQQYLFGHNGCRVAQKTPPPSGTRNGSSELQCTLIISLSYSLAPPLWPPFPSIMSKDVHFSSRIKYSPLVVFVTFHTRVKPENRHVVGTGQIAM